MTGNHFLEKRRGLALIERGRLVKRLSALGHEQAEKLAHVLNGCHAQRPCWSAACPCCGIDFQLAAVACQEREIGIPARAIRHRKHALTIVPGFGCVPPGALTLQFYLEVRQRIATALSACDLPSILFALDVSFNEDLSGRLPPHWCVHGDGIGLDWLPKAKVQPLRAIFPKHHMVSRPVLAQQLDNEDEALLYAFKPERVRRVAPLEGTTKDGQGRRPLPKRHTLRAWQSATLALVEHAAGYRGRLIGHAIRESALEELLGSFERARDGP